MIKVLQPLHSSLFIESNPSPVKFAASLLGMCNSSVRLPLVEIREETKKRFLKLLKLLNYFNEKEKIGPGHKIICLNRKASYNFFFLEKLEAGISLKGSEVKSLRDGKGSIADSYAIDANGELFLINSHIPLYRQSSYNNHDPKGNRKLLLKKKQINKLIGRINQEGLTIIPTKLYFVKGKSKS